MLPIILFVIAIFMLVLKKYSGVLTMVVILTTTYLQLQIHNDFIKPLNYNTSDVGLLLYIFFFIAIANSNGFVFRGKIQDSVSCFLGFILLNGIIDLLLGTPFFDVVRFLKPWLLLTIVYIYPCIDPIITMKSFKQIYYLSLFLCLLVTVLTLANENIGVFAFHEGRGIKPTPFCMWFSVMALFGLSVKKWRDRIFHFFIFVVPVALNMKMTYAGTIVLIFCVYMLFKTTSTLLSRVFLVILLFLGLFVYLQIDNSFNDRFIDMTSQVDDIETGESTGNFSYRILHAKERYQYISENDLSWCRGIGYIQEEHFQPNVFNYGTDHGTSQLNTGDIAWSLMFLRFGMLGILFYLFVYYRLLKHYWKERTNPTSLYLFSMLLVFLCFTSFGNCLIYYPDFFIYPILYLAVKCSRGNFFEYEDCTCTLES